VLILVNVVDVDVAVVDVVINDIKDGGDIGNWYPSKAPVAASAAARK
jgi:hypothetical protein